LNLSERDVAAYYRARLPKMPQRGSRWRTACPIHQGARDSFAVDPFTGLWTCHSACDRGGSVADLEMELQRCDFATAKRAIEQIVGRPQANGNGNARTVVAYYEYKSEQGAPLFRVVRTEPKGFYQQRFEGGQWVSGLGQTRRVLYRLPDLLGPNAAHVQLFVAEGERDVDALRSQGFVATCNAGGAGKWKAEYSDALTGRNVVILPDADEPGRKHATAVATALMGKAASIRIVELPGAKDAAEWFEGRHTADELRALVEAAPQWSPPRKERAVQRPAPQPRRPSRILTGKSCLDTWGEPVKRIEWTIQDLLPKGGLYMLCDREKGGKSYLAIQVALAVTRGQPVFPNRDSFEPDKPGRVHYFDLEMDDETWKSRIRELCDTPERLMFLQRFTELGRLSETAIPELEDLLDREPCDLLVIDTLASVGKASAAKVDIFSAQYQELAQLRDLAHRRGITVLVVHHTSKALTPNVFDSIGGSRGRGAATDGNLVIARAKGVTTLHTVCRRGQPQELAISLFRAGVPGWSLIGDADAARRSKERDDVLRVLSGHGPMQPSEIATALSKRPGTVRKLLLFMTRDGEIERDGEGRYRAILSPAEAGSLLV
jgi:hypothetical protein